MKLSPLERPRERLQAHGSAVLSSAELLAVLIGSGTTTNSVMELSQQLLTQFGGLGGVRKASLHALMQVNGLGKAGALRLQAAFALATRLDPPERALITTPEEAALLVQHLALSDQEQVAILLRDVKGCLVHQEKILIGTLSQVLIHPREVLRPAIAHGAHSYILAHNHPSGDCSPSTADLDLTKVLIEASTLIGIPLDDHIIICESESFSFYDKNFFSKRIKY